MEVKQKVTEGKKNKKNKTRRMATFSVFHQNSVSCGVVTEQHHQEMTSGLRLSLCETMVTHSLGLTQTDLPSSSLT